MNQKKEPIRVLQHVRVLDSGGIEAFIFANYRNIDRGKVQFDFLVTRDQQEFYDDEVKRLGGKKIVLKFKHSSNGLINAIRQSRAFYHFCKNNDYDIIHFQSLGVNGFLDILAAKLAKVPHRIAHSHIANDFKPSRNSKKTSISSLRKVYVQFRQRIIRHLVSALATDYFGCSEMALQWMYTKKINNSKKSIVVKNPIDVSKFAYDESERNKLRTQLKLNDKHVVGHVGRFVYSKNHMFLLDVFAEALKKDNSLMLVLIGAGKLEAQIIDKISELHIRDHVLMLGEKSDVYRYYNVFDTFVFPSIYEGLGIVLVEAQANGLPVIASDSIPHEVKVCDNFQFIGLDESKEMWADKIISCTSNTRSLDNNNMVKAAGYDISDVSKFLQDTYISMHENAR